MPTPIQDIRDFADDIHKLSMFNKNVWILTGFLFSYIVLDPIDGK